MAGRELEQQAQRLLDLAPNPPARDDLRSSRCTERIIGERGNDRQKRRLRLPGGSSEVKHPAPASTAPTIPRRDEADKVRCSTCGAAVRKFPVMLHNAPSCSSCASRTIRPAPDAKRSAAARASRADWTCSSGVIEREIDLHGMSTRRTTSRSSAPRYCWKPSEPSLYLAA